MAEIFQISYSTNRMLYENDDHHVPELTLQSDDSYGS